MISAGLEFALPDGYKIEGFLGSGSYGCVFLATRMIPDPDNEGGEMIPQQVAIKRIADFARRNALCTEEFQLMYTRRVAREVEILWSFRDNYEFVELLSLYLSTDGVDLYIVMPYVENTLQSVLQNPMVRNVGLDEAIVKNIVLQLLLGIRRMKHCGVLHRDITPANILVNASGNWNCFLADFGLGRIVECISADVMTPDVVTLPYRPPELLMNCSRVNNQVDVWSLGCVMAELLRGDAFLHCKDNIKQLAGIIMYICGPPTLRNWEGRASTAAMSFLESNWDKIRDRKPTPLNTLVPKASPEALEVLQAMLRFDPDERATPEELLNFAWFSDPSSQEEIRVASETPSPSALLNVDGMGHQELVAHIESRTTERASHVELVHLP